MVAAMKQGSGDVKPPVGLDLTQFGRGSGPSSNQAAQTTGFAGSSSSRPSSSMAPPPPLFMAASSGGSAAAAPAPAPVAGPAAAPAPAAPMPPPAAPAAPTPSPSPPPGTPPSGGMMPPPPPRVKTSQPHPDPPAPNPSPNPDQPPPTTHPHTPDPLPAPALPQLPGSVNLRNAVAVTRHALLIQQMREMVQAVLRIDIADMQEIASSVADNIRTYMDQQQLNSSSQDNATSQSLEVMEVLTIKAVLKVLDGTSFFDHEPDASPSGSAAVLMLRLAIFGQAASISEPERVTALAFGSMDKVRAFHTACLWLLLRCLRPSNCVRLLRLGQALSLEQLEDAARLYCLTNLKQVLGGPGREEWVQLEVEEVVALLGNSNVQLATELEVWEAVSIWISHSLPDRQHHVGELLGSCLRLQGMNLLQLQQLRQTPLVAGCPEAASLVSAAYTRQMVSSVHLSRSADADPGADTDADGSLLLPHDEHQQHHHHHHHDGGAGQLPSGLLTISPDDEQQQKRPRLGQAGIAAAVVGPEVVGRVDGQG